MKTSRALTAATLGLALLAPGIVLAHEEGSRPASATTMAAIQQAASSGQITQSQAALYQLYSIFDPSRLPEEVRVEGGLPDKCGTLPVMEVQAQLDLMPQEMRKEAESFFVRPNLNSFIDTAHFRIHYSTSGANMIRGWPDTAYRDSVMISCEDSYDLFVANGWPPPPPDGSMGGNSKVDCYVDQLTNVYGVTYSESPSSYYPHYPNSFTSYFIIDNDYVGFPNAPYGAMHVTVAHEFHHCIQMGINIGGGSWWMENTATFMEDEVYDSVNDNYQYLGSYFARPWTGLRTADGMFEYACFIWPTYLKDRWNHSLVWNIWDKLGRTLNANTAFDQAIAAMDPAYDWDLAAAEWARWNIFTWIRDDGNHYAEGADYHNYVALDKDLNAYPQTNVHPSTAKMPQALGTNYTRFRPETGSTDNKLTVTFRALHPCDYGHVISFFRKFAGQTVYEEYVVPLDASGVGTFELTRWDQTDYVMMAAEMARTCTGTGKDFSFDAATTYVMDVAQGIRPTRVVRLDQNAPNPFNPATTIKYAIAAEGPVRVDIFDAAGRHVRTLVDRIAPAGEHEVKWFGQDDQGRSVAAGLYLYAIQAGGETATRKMLMIE